MATGEKNYTLNQGINFKIILGFKQRNKNGRILIIIIETINNSECSTPSFTSQMATDEKNYTLKQGIKL
jgi:hypothetical protein